MFKLPPSYIKNDVCEIWGYISNYEQNKERWNGYYFMIERQNDNIILSSDICGGYRMYYIECNGKYYFSDDYSYLISVLKKNNIPLILNHKEYLYWIKFGYTTGDSTLYSNINKIPPATQFVIAKNGMIVSRKCYFRDIFNTADSIKHTKKSFELLANCFKTLYENNKNSPIILLYSGGVDSTLLAKMLQYLRIPYIAVIMKILPYNVDNLLDLERAKRNIEGCGATTIEYVDVSLEKGYDRNITSLLKDLLFDRHLAISFYETMHFISEKFGKDSVVICGQAADSVLSFGPSDFNLSSFIKRCILYGNKFTNLLFQPLVNKELGRQYSIVLNRYEKMLAFCDHTRYIYALNSNVEYFSLLKNVVDSCTTHLKSSASKYMYLKLFTHLQGSDNQVVIKSANAFGINKVILPFTSVDMVYTTVRYKSIWREIFCPKYVVRDILKRYFRYNSYFNQYKGKISFTPNSNIDITSVLLSKIMKAFNTNIMDRCR